MTIARAIVLGMLCVVMALAIVAGKRVAPSDPHEPATDIDLAATRDAILASLPTPVAPVVTATTPPVVAATTPEAVDRTLQQAAPSPSAARTPVTTPAVATPTLAARVDPAIAVRNRERATLAWQALQEHFYLPADGVYRDRYAPGEGYYYAYLWPMSQTLAAASQVASLPGRAGYADDVAALLEIIDYYWDEREPVPGYQSYLPLPWGWESSDRYYDDNVWLGLALIDAYRASGDERALDAAREVFEFMLGGWDTDPAHGATGGIYWIESDDNGNRNTVSTAPAIQLGLLLFELSADEAERERYLDWSLRMYDWLERHLDAGNGLYWDHVRADGAVDTAFFSYNQGAMIGANLMLHRVSGDARFLERAHQTAQASLDRAGGRWLAGQEIAFNAIFFHELLLLDAVDARPAYRDAAQTYADRIWETARDPETNLATTSYPLTLLDQAALVQLYAYL